jgi:putative ABC transport system permease protein
MSLWRQLSRGLRVLTHRRAADKDVADEIQHFVDQAAAEFVASGLSPEEAQRAAKLEMGTMDDVREQIRERGWENVVGSFFTDLRYGLRMLRKSPGFTSLVVLILALGIGANSTIFSTVNALLLRPLPYPQSDRLVYVIDSNPKLGWPRFSASPANFLDWRDRSHSFEQMVALGRDVSNVIVRDLPEQWTGQAATQGFFAALKVNPSLGRAFNDDDFVTGKNHVIVLSDGLWRSAFGADPNVIGRNISLDGQPTTIVGVMPRDFQFGGETVLYWRPYPFDPSEMSARGAHYLRVMARLRDGVAIGQAQQEMKQIAAQLEQQYPNSNRGWTVVVESMQKSSVRTVHTALLVLLGAVGFVLLIACANVANMLLARAAGRRREIAIRMALGAGRRRIVGQLLIESVLLALAGGGLGLAIVYWSARSLAALPTTLLPRASSIHIDTSVLTFTLVLAVATGILFGLAPALTASREDLVEAFKEGSNAIKGRRGKLSGALVVVEVALAMILLVASGLLLRSFAKLTSVNPGVVTQGRLTFNVSLTQSQYPKPEQWISFYQQAQQNLESLPAVKAVTMTSLIPMSGDESLWTLGIKGQANSTSLPSAMYYLVVPGYLKTMGIPLLAGRDFNERDTAKSNHVCIVNNFLARTLFPGKNPLGQHIQLGRSYDVIREIVGVVGSVKQTSLEDKDDFQTYEPFVQMPRPSMTFILRTEGSAASLLPSARQAIQQVDSREPITHPLTMDEIVQASVALPRLRTLLLGSFAAQALVLALFGLYSVLSYAVAQQSQEIGIRMALGAHPRDVYRLVFGRGMALVAAGIAVGLVGTIAVARLFAAFLFGVTTHDPTTITAMVVLFVAIAMLACWIPARRAMRVDPMAALRYE